MTRDGRITAVQAELLADGGAYASTSAEVTKVATLFASGVYEIPNIAVEGKVVYTNNIPSGAFRGFGAPQAQFAAEVMVTRLAHAIGMDPSSSGAGISIARAASSRPSSRYRRE